MSGEISNTSQEIVEVLNLDTNTVETIPGPGFTTNIILNTEIYHL